MPTPEITTQQPLTPFIFSCQTCRSIVADSTDFFCACESLSLVAFSGASGLRIDSIDQRITVSGVEGESTYRAIICDECGSAVGRAYSEVPEALEALKGSFVLDTRRLVGYELGSAVQRAAGAERVQRQPAESAFPPAPQPPADGAAALTEQLAQRVAQLELSHEQLITDMLNVQHVLSYHSSRLDNQGGET